MTAPLTPAQIAAWRAEHTLAAHAREIADSHDRLTAELVAQINAGIQEHEARLRAEAERDEAHVSVEVWTETTKGAARLHDREVKLAAARAEVARLREALTWYADPETWEQVDLLGRCPLSADRDDEGLLGMRAREAIGPHISDALGSIRAALFAEPERSAPPSGSTPTPEGTFSPKGSAGGDDAD